MEWRISNYLVSIGHLDIAIPKGFLREVGGCVEYSETVYRAALDARTHKRDLVISWIDLKNAYGSVKHSLIQFALEWYHVPKDFCELMWSYYEGLMAAVLVNGAVTSSFWFEVGVFQGCTVSTVCSMFHSTPRLPICNLWKSPVRMCSGIKRQKCYRRDMQTICV